MITDYYWHGEATLGTWNRIVAGSTQHLDTDICKGHSSFAQEFNFDKLGQDIYLNALPYSMQMTSSLLSNGGFSNGGNSTHWPYGGGWIRYRAKTPASTAVFLPAVIPPPLGSPKDTATALDPWKVRVYRRGIIADDLLWDLPPLWSSKKIASTTISPSGRSDGPLIEVCGDKLLMKAVPALRPVILTVREPVIS